MNNRTPIRVILADDHQVVRRGIRDFLVETGEIEVVAEAETGEEALDLIARHRPDVAVLDIQMPGQSGLDVVRAVRQTDRSIGLLILTAYDDDPYLLAALEAGVNGYVMKTADAEDIIHAVRAVHEGKSVLDPSVIDKIMTVLSSQSAPQPSESELTTREIDVLFEAACGLTNKAIGLKLGISDRTVQGHLRNIFEKLGVTNRTEAVVKAAQMGILKLPEGK